MKRIAHVLSGVRRNEQGFSMAEILVAITLFVAAVLGVGSLLISGGSLISGSARANTAMRLASGKIEEVKSIPFYVPWDSNPADIDDTYWRFDEGGQPMSNADQVSAPWRDDEASPNGKYQKYGMISGFTGYKRTTTIQYVYVVGTAPSTHLEPAVMNSDWVPSNPGSGEDDRPMGGIDSSATDKLHMLTIEVIVSYMENGKERTFTERALADDLIGPRTSTEHLMVVQSILPNFGYKLDDNLACRISIDAPGMTAGEEVVVTLWRAGCNDIPTIETTLTTTSPSRIDCHFNLEQLEADEYPLGYYNLSVYWLEMGFKDSNLRNCFELREESALRIDTVKTEDDESPAWGFEEQDARTLSINGNGFTGANAVNLRSGVYIMPGGDITVSEDGRNLLATFNPSLQAWFPDMAWDLEVKVGASTATKPGCFVLNPRPEIKGVADSGEYGGEYYFDWANRAQKSRNVKLTGDYLYGLDGVFLPVVKLVDDSGEPVHECAAARQVAAGESDINHWKKDTWVIIEFDPSTGTEGGFDLDSKCYVTAQNYGGISKTDPEDPTQNVLMNPRPVISSEDIPDSAIRKTAEQPNKTVSGSYFPESIPGALDSYLVLVSKSNNPQLGGEHAPCLVLPVSSVSWDGVSINCGFDPGKDRFVWLDDLEQVVPGTAPEFTNELYYDYYLYLLNIYDPDTPGMLEQWSAYNPGFTCDIQHGTPKVTAGAEYGGQVNYWDVSLDTLTAYCFDTEPFETYPSACQIQMWSDDLLTCYDPYNGDPTVEGTPVVTGDYGNATAQTVVGLYANLIDIPAGDYRLVLVDRENGKSSAREDSLPFNVKIWIPTVEAISPASVADNGTRTLTVTSKGSVGSCTVMIGVNWVAYSSPYGFKTTQWVWMTNKTMEANRHNKYVNVTGNLLIPFKFNPTVEPYAQCCLSVSPWNCEHDVYVINMANYWWSGGYGFLSIVDD